MFQPARSLRCFALLSLVSLTRLEASPEVLEETQLLKETIVEIRNIGTAMMSWLTDQITGDEFVLDAPAVKEQKGWTVRMEGEEEAGTFSVVPPEFLAGLLVPDYMPELPLADAWGNPYEFAINADFLGDQVLGIRSAGKDGVFDGDDYSAAGHLTGANLDVDEILARDILWTDGYLLELTTSSQE